MQLWKTSSGPCSLLRDRGATRARPTHSPQRRPGLTGGGLLRVGAGFAPVRGRGVGDFPGVRVLPRLGDFPGTGDFPVVVADRFGTCESLRTAGGVHGAFRISFTSFVRNEIVPPATRRITKVLLCTTTSPSN
jgi:hypothetical protein